MRFIIAFFICTIPLFGSADALKRVVDLRGQWKFSIGDNPHWALPEYNDSNWEEIFVPSQWEDEGFSGFDGYAWYRTQLDLRKVSDKNLYLLLGYIDDVDEVYLNGQLIGFSGSFPPNFYTAYNSMRKYYIPEGLLNKNGLNTIAVRVYDAVLDGGILKGDVGVYTHYHEPDKAYLLEGIWKFREGDSRWWKEVEYDASHWQNILVPGFWRSLKKAHIEGEAWYRKAFEVPGYLLSEQSLVLVLGLIDDFDETYLNGVLLGSTNDGKSFGRSESYQTYRVYHIPPNLIKKTGVNIIAVHVTDIGADAGIYAGPIGIMPEDQYKRLLWTRKY